MVALEAAAGSIVKAGLQKRKERPAGIRVPPYTWPPTAWPGSQPAWLPTSARAPAEQPGQGGAAGRRRPLADAWDGGTESANTVVVALAPAGGAARSPAVVRPAHRSPARRGGGGRSGRPDRLVPAPSRLRRPGRTRLGDRALGIVFESEYAPGRAPSGFQPPRESTVGRPIRGSWGGRTRNRLLMSAGWAASPAGPSIPPGCGCSGPPSRVPDRPRRLDGPRRRAALLPRPARGRMGIPGHRSISPGADAARIGTALDREHVS